MKRVVLGAVVAALAVCVCTAVIYTNHNINIKYYDKQKHKSEIRILINKNLQDKKSNVYQEIITGYNEHAEDTVIKCDFVSGSDYYSRLRVDFASGNEPEIFVSWPGMTTRELLKQGKIVDLSETLKLDSEWYDSFERSSWKYVTENDTIIGLPLIKTYATLFVNIDVLDSVGIDIPKNYEQLKAAVVTLKEAGIVPIAADISDDGLLIYRYIAALLGGKFNASAVDHNTVPNEYYVKASEYIKELYQLGAFPQNLFSLSETERDYLFLSKKAAFIVQYSDFMGDVYENGTLSTVNIDFFPSFDNTSAGNESILYGVGMDTLFVASDSWETEEKKKQILSVLKHFASKETASYMAKNLGVVPTVKIEKAKTKVENSAYKKNTELFDTVREYIDFPNYYINEDVLIHVTDNFPEFLEDGKTINEVWEDAINYVKSN